MCIEGQQISHTHTHVHTHARTHTPHRAGLARHAIGAGDLLEVLDFREPEVPYLEVSVFIEQEVCRLKVAVDDDGIAIVQET